jgi:hypothetical protein
MRANRTAAITGRSASSPPGAYEFFSALMDRCTIGEAVSRAIPNAPNFDLTGCFSALLSADIVVTLQPTTRVHDIGDLRSKAS